MREAGKALKQAVKAILDAALTNPVFDGKVEGSVNTYTMMTLTSENNTSTKTSKVTEGTLELSVNNIRNATAQSEVLEDEADLIKQALDAEISLPDPFNLTFFRFDNAGSTTMRQLEGTKFIHTKPLTYRFRITQ